MARKSDRRDALKGETQRESSARMAAQRVSNAKRFEIKRLHLQLEEKTGRRRR
jgi:hypothetical protein